MTPDEITRQQAAGLTIPCDCTHCEGKPLPEHTTSRRNWRTWLPMPHLHEEDA